ncbi:FAD-dependent monooxygenase [Nonomuraea sp. NPDC046570]|uniref:FAD-dependent monooxygenase n=1 Tax=Nonomuraea sp. NPDC046570 TaxID=3155255 RepID=UPI0033F33CCF
MKVACVGGGPASLYFSILMKRVDPSHDITVYERNPATSTYGWGVTFGAELLSYLHVAEPESARAISESSVSWDNWVTRIHDRATVTEQAEEGFGISRHRLLAILADRARALGVRVEFQREIAGEDELADADLVVAGDGVNSVLRERHADHFGAEVRVERNTYIWLGTTKVFDSFIFAFVQTEHGWIWCYGYRFSEDQSTCVIECAPATWKGLEFDQANEAESLILLEKLFADILDGHPLIGRPQADGSAHWLNFRTLTNRRWYRGNLVLLGDAAHTTHFSIGAGTTLALEDAAYLVAALHGDTRLRPGLAGYEQQRRSTIRQFHKAARYSAQWYENLPRYIDLPPMELVALQSRRESSLLPHVPPRLYYQMGRTVESLCEFKHRLGSKLARTRHAYGDGLSGGVGS